MTFVPAVSFSTVAANGNVPCFLHWRKQELRKCNVTAIRLQNWRFGCLPFLSLGGRANAWNASFVVNLLTLAVSFKINFCFTSLSTWPHSFFGNWTLHSQQKNACQGFHRYELFKSKMLLLISLFINGVRCYNRGRTSSFYRYPVSQKCCLAFS